jgi:hypothetical protein
MRNNFKILLSDSVIKIALYISVSIIVLQTILTGFFFNNLPPVIPFFNSQPWGEARLFNSWGILFIPVILLLGFCINAIIASLFYKMHALIARMIIFNGLLFVVLGFLAFLQIVLLVF